MLLLRLSDIDAAPRGAVPGNLLSVQSSRSGSAKQVDGGPAAGHQARPVRRPGGRAAPARRPPVPLRLATLSPAASATGGRAHRPVSRGAQSTAKVAATSAGTVLTTTSLANACDVGGHCTASTSISRGPASAASSAAGSGRRATTTTCGTPIAASAATADRAVAPAPMTVAVLEAPTAEAAKISLQAGDIGVETRPIRPVEKHGVHRAHESGPRLDVGEEADDRLLERHGEREPHPVRPKGVEKARECSLL